MHLARGGKSIFITVLYSPLLGHVLRCFPRAHNHTANFPNDYQFFTVKRGFSSTRRRSGKWSNSKVGRPPRRIALSASEGKGRAHRGSRAASPETPLLLGDGFPFRAAEQPIGIRGDLSEPGRPTWTHNAHSPHSATPQKFFS